MTQSIEIQRKRQFLLKQTEEQRQHLDELAAHVGLSRTAYVQRVLDLEWKLLERQRTAEAQVTKAPPTGDHPEAHFSPGLVALLTPAEIAFINEAVDESDTPAPTPCACDGNCAGCWDAEGACQAGKGAA